jgi:cyclase
VSTLLDAGADKVVIGSGALEVEGLVGDLSQVFGSQALVCAVDVVDDRGAAIAVRSGTVEISVAPLDAARTLEAEGAGEILLQNVKRDGLMGGPDLARIAEFGSALSVPLIVGSGIASGSHVVHAREAGASAVSVGALFQFTEETPQSLKNSLAREGIPVRR